MAIIVFSASWRRTRISRYFSIPKATHGGTAMPVTLNSSLATSQVTERVYFGPPLPCCTSAGFPLPSLTLLLHFRLSLLRLGFAHRQEFTRADSPKHNQPSDFSICQHVAVDDAEEFTQLPRQHDDPTATPVSHAKDALEFFSHEAHTYRGVVEHHHTSEGQNDARWKALKCPTCTTPAWSRSVPRA